MISRRDSAVEPLELMPDQQVAAACAARDPANAFDRARYAEPAVAARVAELR